MSVDVYYRRFQVADPQIESPPAPDLGLVMVIPCFNEPDLKVALEAIWACQRPLCSVETIVIINSPADAPPKIYEQNQATFAQASQWADRHRDPRLQFHLLNFPDLPRPDAGVGLARKLGMDEAARRFDAIGNARGIIACFDADCQCDSNYLCALEQQFQNSRDCPGCSVYFEHLLNGSFSPEIYDAIAAYELHLRYYIQALRFARFPYAFHTVGSSMAVLNSVYKEQGGMNKRRAGEDFYFLHKVIPLGGFADVVNTRVIPSPRISDRVPFGTGRAVGQFIQRGFLETYPLRAFFDLRQCFENVGALYRTRYDWSGWLLSVPKTIREFLNANHFDNALQQLVEQTTSETAFRKRFFHWFNGFRVMKFVHFARDRFYGPAKLQSSARELLLLVLRTTPKASERASKDQVALPSSRRLPDQGSVAVPLLCDHANDSCSIGSNLDSSPERSHRFIRELLQCYRSLERSYPNTIASLLDQDRNTTSLPEDAEV